MIGLYCYHCLINGKNYIGQSIDIDYRIKKHNQPSSKDTLIDKAINKYGIENFEIIKLECDKNLLNFLEQYYIYWGFGKEPLGYNISDGGQSANGIKHTDEWKLQHSIRMTGDNNPMYGKPGTWLGKKFTEEHKRKISESNKGKVVVCSDAAREKMSQTRKGKKFSEQHKNNIRKTQILNGNPMSKEILWEDIGIIFESAKECSRQTGIHVSTIQNCCTHRTKTALGYHFRYLKE